MATNVNELIFIKRVKKKAHEHAHGGAWKIAYADFVTAMMAFFLLMWLLNATTEDQRTAISNYFAPASVSKSTSGAGGVLGGRTLDSEGAMTSNTSSPGLILGIRVPTSGDADGNADEESPATKAPSSSVARWRRMNSRVRPAAIWVRSTPMTWNKAVAAIWVWSRKTTPRMPRVNILLAPIKRAVPTPNLVFLLSPDRYEGRPVAPRSDG